MSFTNHLRTPKAQHKVHTDQISLLAAAQPKFLAPTSCRQHSGTCFQVRWHRFCFH